MRNSQQEFPHPYLALGRNDYDEKCTFAVTLEEQTIAEGNFVFKFAYKLECEGLEKMITDGIVRAILRVKSPMASFRASYDFDARTHRCKIIIPVQNVAKVITAQAFLVAGDHISSFALPEQNQVYFHGIHFSLRKGDQLGESESFDIMLDDSELQKPLSSIFIIESNENNESIIPTFYTDKIKILLSPRLFDVYYKMRKKGEMRRYLSASIIVPALVEALSIMKSDEDADTYSQLRWYRAIQTKLPKCGVTNIHDPGMTLTTIANRLLGDISWEALNSLKTTFDAINSASDTIDLEQED